jgi:hypothetical protein
VSTLSEDGEIDLEVDKRIQAGWKKWKQIIVWFAM